MIINFTVPGKITGKQRARVTKWGAHTPEATVLYENLIKSMFLQKTKGETYQCYGGAVTLDIVAHMKMPKSFSQKKKIEKRGKACLKSPDKDNCEKVVADSLNMIAYKDDRQVWDGRTTKIWDDEEKLEITIQYDEIIGE